MSDLLRQQIEAFTLAAGEARAFNGQFDFIFYETLPAGVVVALNDNPEMEVKQGSVRQGAPGENQIERFRVVNPTAGALAVKLMFGTGQMTIAGEAVITGAVPLPANASTAAKQDTGNTSLASILADLAALATNALQTAANALLTTISGLAATTVEVPDLVTLGTSADQTYSGCRRVTVLNTNTGSEAVTLNFAGGADRSLAAGQSASFPVTKPLATLSAVRVRTTGSGSALVSTVT